MALPQDVQDRRTRVFVNILVAVTLAIPMVGWAAMAFLACVTPFVILIKSQNRIVDLLMLVVFVVCYTIASGVSYALFGEHWMLSGIPVIPLSFYFLYQADQREFGRAEPQVKPAPPIGPRQLPSHWE